MVTHTHNKNKATDRQATGTRRCSARRRCRAIPDVLKTTDEMTDRPSRSVRRETGHTQTHDTDKDTHTHKYTNSERATAQ